MYQNFLGGRNLLVQPQNKLNSPCNDKIVWIKGLLRIKQQEEHGVDSMEELLDGI